MNQNNGTPVEEKATTVKSTTPIADNTNFAPDFNAEEETSVETPAAPVKKSRFGITKETASAAGIPIGAPVEMEKRTDIYPNGYEFPVGRLVRVGFNPAKETKNNPEPVPVVEFVFATAKGKKFTHIEFPVDEDDQHFDKKLENMNQRIKHIFDETIGVNRFKEGSMLGENFNEFFSNVANAFNAEVITKEDKTIKVYATNDIYIKLTYYKDRLNFSQFPNFVQRAADGKGNSIVCELLINPKYDNIKPVVGGGAGTPGGYAPPAQPNFGGGGDFANGDFPDFPM